MRQLLELILAAWSGQNADATAMAVGSHSVGPFARPPRTFNPALSSNRSVCVPTILHRCIPQKKTKSGPGGDKKKAAPVETHERSSIDRGRVRTNSMGDPQAWAKVLSPQTGQQTNHREQRGLHTSFWSKTTPDLSMSTRYWTSAAQPW